MGKLRILESQDRGAFSAACPERVNRFSNASHDDVPVNSQTGSKGWNGRLNQAERLMNRNRRQRRQVIAMTRIGVFDTTQRWRARVADASSMQFM
jgi:hypothetical protein